MPSRFLPSAPWSVPMWLMLSGLMLSGLMPNMHPAAAQGMNQSDIFTGQYELIVKDCRSQLESDAVDECIYALKNLESQLSATSTDAMLELRNQIGYRIQVMEAYKIAGAKGNERPDRYYRALFKAYAALPEKYFPYDEVLPLWNRFLRDETSRVKFNRYRRLKMMVRSPKDKDLSPEFSVGMETLLLRYGYDLLDPKFASSGRPKVLLKATIYGDNALDVTDPRLQGKSVYRLTLDITTLKFIDQDKSVRGIEEEIVVGANLLSKAKEKAVKQGNTRLTHLLFYYTLRQMYPPSNG